jgi:hypothetical protein
MIYTDQEVYADDNDITRKNVRLAARRVLYKILTESEHVGELRHAIGLLVEGADEF